ncbi:MAG: hypothetical protein K2J02_02600 [Malacoplasma sp.]|nr:hypothetical protein [Malacoplasma sp.]MDE6894247.1 hypothetical protein [Malacoplasma sp.]
MKKIHKVAISTILIFAFILFVVVAAWQPCAYAFIAPAILAVIGISYLITAIVAQKSENKKISISTNA